ncbi:MAG TPA: hypothetical protein VNK45_00755 [Candidatus Acidoferrales bacterium]|nr:hypothetical protein [Candidatus Acidoferrales bacterium]
MTLFAWLIPLGALATGLLLGWLLASRARINPASGQRKPLLARAEDGQARWLAFYALANGNRERAAFILEHHLETPKPYHTDDWIMLLDIHHASGNRDRFDAIAQRYAAASGNAAPTFNEWKQLYPDGSGLNRRHPKLLELLNGMGDRDQQRKFLATLALDSARPGRPAFTLNEAEELLKLRARLTPKVVSGLTLTHSLAIPPGTLNPPRAIQPEPPSEMTLPPKPSLGRTGSQPVPVTPLPPPNEDPRCALERKFQRIADKIVESWPRADCAKYIDSLLVDTRGGRQGFPPEVVSELFVLHALLEEHHSPQRDRWEGLTR